jgi:hypothetical protein
MLRANIAKALEGSYLHMKTLFEYAGVWPAETPAAEGESSLAALLLEKLESATEERLRSPLSFEVRPPSGANAEVRE